MTSSTIRAFALGLIVSSVIIGTVYNFFMTEKELTEEQMIEILEDNHYLVTKITNSTIDESSDSSNDDEQQNPITDEQSNASSEQEQDVEESAPTLVSITVAAGMNSWDVGKLLEAQNIVKANDFYQAVIASGKETKLKQGTFSIPSNATSTEIISIIFK